MNKTASGKNRGYRGYLEREEGTNKINIYLSIVPSVPSVPSRILSPIEKLFRRGVSENIARKKISISKIPISRGYRGYRWYRGSLGAGFWVPSQYILEGTKGTGRGYL